MPQQLFEVSVRCTTTDIYQVYADSEAEAMKLAEQAAGELVRTDQDSQPETDWSTATAKVVAEHELRCEGCRKTVMISTEFDLCDCPECGRDCLSARIRRVEKAEALGALR